MGLDQAFQHGPIGGLPFPIWLSGSTFSLTTSWGSAIRNYPDNIHMDWRVGRSICLALCRQWASNGLIFWETRWVLLLHSPPLSLIPKSLTVWYSWVQWV